MAGGCFSDHYCSPIRSWETCNRRFSAGENRAWCHRRSFSFRLLYLTLYYISVHSIANLASFEFASTPCLCNLSFVFMCQ